ncbi:MAG: DUF308 domain-containing protein [Bacteroidales bacterium]|nr:DUF308 domain-containing protein [Bacteroidales bacterium]
MKTLNYSLITGIVCLILGIILVSWPELVADYIVFAVGFLFVLPGVIAVVQYLINNKKNAESGVSFTFPLAGFGSCLLGLLLMIKAQFFANAIVFTLGLVISLLGIYQIAQLFQAREWVHVSFAPFIIPILLFIMGIVMIFNVREAKKATFVIIGIGVLVYAVSALMNWILYYRKKPKPAIEKTLDIEDAEIIEENKSELNIALSIISDNVRSV